MTAASRVTGPWNLEDEDIVVHVTRALDVATMRWRKVVIEIGEAAAMGLERTGCCKRAVGLVGCKGLTR